MNGKLNRWFILIGVSLVALGVLFSYMLKQHNSDDREFVFLSSTFLPMLLIGSVVTLAASVRWAWRAPILRLSAYGLLLSASALVAAMATPINIHDWTVTLMFSYVTALSVGASFLTLGTVRFILSRLAPNRK